MSENKASDTENIKDFESDRISFSADMNSGFVTAVRNPDDPHGMNWVLDMSMPYSTVFGKRYDDWANDQDWALYYAYKYRNTVN